MSTVVNENSDVYYRGKYWNDFKPVLAYMCKNFTGDETKWWVQDFKERFAQEPLERGLFLNCGNGWVERDFIDKNIVKKAIAFDYSTELLKIAEREKGERAITYFQADVNKVEFEENKFDLVVNVAALHHVQYINRLCYILAKAIKREGYFANFDYIGPHRNQYSLRHWWLVKKVNNSLPKDIQKSPLNKPHLPTMLYADPTEAIHSELIIETVSRFFYILDRHDTGGGIAYEILTHNPKAEDLPDDKLNNYIAEILKLDRKYTDEKKAPPLFSYFIAQPNKKILSNKSQIIKYQEIENRREEIASRFGGIYSISDYLKLKMNVLQNKLKKHKWLRRLKSF